MLLIAEHLKQINMKMLASVYEESNRKLAKNGNNSALFNLRFIEAENDFYDYMAFFLRDPNSFVAILAEGERYLSAVRIELYLDGVLLSGLETIPSERGKGYAVRLLQELMIQLKDRAVTKVYSHIDRNNSGSISVHMRCGFNRILDYAKCIDGSILRSMDTYAVTLRL